MRARPIPPALMPAAHRILKVFRSLHLYFGVFTAPALLFFAFTGALQSVPLHEATRDSPYKPPAWVVAIAHLHKKQTPDVAAKPSRPGSAVAAAGAGPAPAGVYARGPSPAPRKRNLVPMKTWRCRSA